MIIRKPTIRVVPGQIWADKYPGSAGRTVHIVEVGPTHATVEVATEAHSSWSNGNTIGRQTRVSYGPRGLNGYRLESEPAAEPIDHSDGPVQDFFGLTHSSYQVVPRVLAQSMPHEWQARFVKCMEEMETAFAHIETPNFYDVRPAVEKEIGELTNDELIQLGISAEHGALGAEDVYYNRDFDEIDSHSRVMVPVPDPLPSYNRGRTRVPRADQLAQTGGKS